MNVRRKGTTGKRKRPPVVRNFPALPEGQDDVFQTSRRFVRSPLAADLLDQLQAGGPGSAVARGTYRVVPGVVRMERASLASQIDIQELLSG